MPRIDFNDPESLTLARTLVKHYEVGGFIIFGGTPDIVRRATEELQALSRTPLFFGCDAERGTGQIVKGMTLYPFTMSLGAIGDTELVYKEASLIAKEMRQCGLNLVFGPVADVNTNPHNPIINIRSYGDSPTLVSDLVEAFIRGLQDGGVTACAKHFPGHGDTGVDSHHDMPVSDQSEEDLFKLDLIPFKRAVASGVTFIMPAHIAYPNISGQTIPATASKDVITGILRNKLGFKGLVVSDSFRMEGIGKSGGEADTSALSIMSGCDIILDPKDPEALIQNLINMAESGDLDLNAAAEAAGRIIEVKNKWLTQERIATKSTKEDTPGLIRTIAERSPCLIKGGAIKSDDAFVYTFDVTGSGPGVSSEFINSITDAGVGCEHYNVSDTDTEAIVDLSQGKDNVICLIFTTVGAYKKPPVLPENFKAILHKIGVLPKEKILVSFGSPYVLSKFNGFDTVLSIFDTMDVCQKAAADVLTGKLNAGGIMPVKL